MSTLFEESLKEGVKFEKIAVNLLFDHFGPNCSIEDLSNHQKNGEYRGPRLKTAEGDLILPDFRVWLSGEQILIDAKLKKDPFRWDDLDYFSVDQYKIEEYRKVGKYTGANKIGLLFGDLLNKKIYLHYLEDKARVVTRARPDKGGYIVWPLFPAEDKYLIADLIINDDSFNYKIP